MKSTKIFNLLLVKIFLIISCLILLPVSINFLRPFNAFWLLIINIIVLSLCFTLLLIVLKPLRKILQTTENLKSGNLNTRLDIRSGDEFEEWANSFNSVAAYLQQNLTNAEQAQAITLAAKNRLNTILSSVIDGIIAIDLSRNVVSANKAAEAITGFTETQLINHPIDEFIHLYDGQQEIPSKNYCQITMGPQDSNPALTQVVTLVGRDGNQTKVSLSSAPIAEGIQANLGCLIILHDLSKEEELEQMKLDFVSMASHELRTPLTSIIGYLSVFIDENKDKIPKEELELIDRSLVSSRELLILVSNLLSVNKIEREQLTLLKEPLDWQTHLQKAIDDLQNQAKLKSISLTLIEPTTPLPKIMADPIRISEVINNLVTNAINYTSPGGKIEVSTSSTPNEVITTISDNGVGIPQEAIPHLFSKFFRVSNQLQKTNKGTGLGLYISKSIITKLGGKIWVESQFGKGSKFHFNLPVANTIGIPSQQFTQHAIQEGALNY